MGTLVRGISILVVISTLSLIHGRLLAQVATDGTLGVRATIAGPTYAVPNSLGTQRGGNLFHSFSTFNIRAGETAVGPQPVAGVFRGARVLAADHR